MEDMQLEYPLLNYAVENLVYHIKNADPRNVDVLEAIATLLIPGSAAYGVWMYHKWESRLCSTFSTVHLATFTGMPMPVIEYLSPSGTDAQDGNERTPLSYAAENGYTEAARFFLDRGADPTSGDRFGFTPLYYATYEQQLDVVKLLVEVYAVSPLSPATKQNPDHVEFTSERSSKETPLKIACRIGNADIMTLFMPFIPPEMSNQCLHWVKDATLVETILKAGHADVDCFGDGKTKLFKAAARHEFETMELLLQYGADPNRRCSGETLGIDNIITLDVDNPRGPMPIHAFAGCDRRTYQSCNEDDLDKCLHILITTVLVWKLLLTDITLLVVRKRLDASVLRRTKATRYSLWI